MRTIQVSTPPKTSGRAITPMRSSRAVPRKNVRLCNPAASCHTLSERAFTQEAVAHSLRPSL